MLLPNCMENEKRLDLNLTLSATLIQNTEIGVIAMEKSKVYFTDFRTVAFGDGLPTKLKKMIKKAGIGQIDMEGKFVAIKMHFGELGNISYLRPNYAKNWAESHFSQTAIPCIREAERTRWNICSVHGKTDLPRYRWDVPY